MSEETTTSTETTTTTPSRRIFTAQELSRCRKLLAEESAVLVSLERGTWRKRIPPPEGSAEGTPATFQDASWVRLIRKWPRISEGDRAICEEFLARFASAKNATITQPAEQPEDRDTVEDPRTDREKYAGTWRMRRTALTPLRTDPNQQGVYQTLVWPAEFEGEVGGYCSESSPLHHEDATVYSNAAEPPDAEHANVPGHIYRVNGSIDPETGLWSGQKTDDIARTPGLYGTWSTRADAVTLRVRGEHAAAPFFPLLSGATAAAIKALADDFISATATTDEQKAAALASALSLCDHPAMTSTADMDAYGLFSVSVEITFPVEQIAAAVLDQVRRIDLEASFSNYDAPPDYDAAMDAIQGTTPTDTLKSYKLVTGLSIRQNEFGLLDGTVSWRVPKSGLVNELHGNARYEDIEVSYENYAALPTWSESIQGLSPTGLVSYRIASSFNIRLNEYGLLEGTTHWRIPKSAFANQAHDQTRHTDVEVSYENWVSLPTWSEATSGLTIPSALVAFRLATSFSVRLNEFGLLEGSTRWRIPKEGIVSHTHAHPRWEDVEIAFENKTTIPSIGAVTRTTSGALDSYKIIASSGIRLNEFGLLDGSVTWRVPFCKTVGWKKVSEDDDTERLVYQCWGWNMGGGTGLSGAYRSDVVRADGSTVSGSSAGGGESSQGGGGSGGGGSSETPGTCYVTVNCLGVQGATFKIDGAEYPSGSTVELVAERAYWVEFVPVDNYETPPGLWTSVLANNASESCSGTYTPKTGTPASPIACALLDIERGVYYAVESGASDQSAPCQNGGYYLYQGKIWLCTETNGVKSFTEVTPVSVDGLDTQSTAKCFDTVLNAQDGNYYVDTSDGNTLWFMDDDALSEVANVPSVDHADGSCPAGSDVESAFAENIAYDVANANPVIADRTTTYNGSFVLVLPDGTYEAPVDGEVYYFTDPNWRHNNGAGYYLAEYDSDEDEWTFTPATGPIWRKMEDGAVVFGGYLENGVVYHFSCLSDNAGGTRSGYFRVNENTRNRTWRFTAVSGPRWYKPDGTSFGGYLEDGAVYHFSDPSWEDNDGSGYYRADCLIKGYRKDADLERGKLLDDDGNDAGNLRNNAVYFFSEPNGGDDAGGFYRAIYDDGEWSIEEYDGSLWELESVTGPKWYSVVNKDADLERGKLLDDDGNDAGNLRNNAVYFFSEPNGGDDAGGFYRAIYDDGEWSIEEYDGSLWEFDSNAGIGYLQNGGIYSIDGSYRRAVEVVAGTWRFDPVTCVEAVEVDATHNTYTVRTPCVVGAYYEVTEYNVTTVYLCSAGQAEGETLLTAITQVECVLLDKDRARYLASGSVQACVTDTYYGIGGETYYFNGEEAVPYDPDDLVEQTEHAGTYADPIPIASIVEGTANVVLHGYESDSPVAATPGKYYKLMEGEDTGTIYTLEDGELVVANPPASPQSRALVRAAAGSGSSINDVSSLPSGPSLPSNTANKYYVTKSIRLDFNEFGLVDYVGTAEAEMNPWWGSGGNGITYSSKKTRMHYVFIANNTRSSVNNNKGFLRGVRDTATTQVFGFATRADATAKANSIVSGGSNSQTIVAHVSRHGHWWTVEATVETHHS